MTGLVGVLLHEIRPYKNNASMTFDKEAVEARKQEIAEDEAKIKAAGSKKKR